MSIFKLLSHFFSTISRRRILIFSLIVFCYALTFVVYRGSLNNKPQATENLEQQHPYNTYNFSDDSKIINFGDQPYFMPASLVFTIMRKDRVFFEELNKLGLRLKTYHFLKGNDVNYFMHKGKLDAGFSGDMPTLRLASSMKCNIVSSFKGPMSIVSRDIREVQDLAKKKIAYAFGSNAHFYLLKTLENNNVSKDSIKFFEMDITKMEKALQSHEIDAYSTWELAPPTTTNTIQNKITTHKGTTFGFLTFSDSFSKKHPKAIKQFIAAQIRAVRWLKQDENNINLLCLWIYEVLQKWDQREVPLSIEKTKRHVVEATSRVYLQEIPRLPKKEFQDRGLLKQEFLFLKEQHFIAEDVAWDDTIQSFNFNIINDVISNQELYRLNEFSFDYSK